MKTLPQDLSKLPLSASSNAKAASIDFTEAMWTVVGFIVLVLMLTFLVFVTQAAPRPDQTDKVPVKSRATTNQSIAEVRI